ncbi:MAG: hypothetical protein J7639_03600 [Paenibacillaceae bacterium]|nr:hypothetical protein [Paenibacillaceae bacterium]
MSISSGASNTKHGHKLRQASGVLAAAMALSPLALSTAGNTANAAITPPPEVTVLAGDDDLFDLLNYFSFASGSVSLNVYAQNIMNNTTYTLSGTTLTFSGYDGWEYPVLSHNKSANTSTFMVNDSSTSDWYPFNVRVAAEPFQKLQIPDQNIAKGGSLSIPFASIFGDEDDDFSELTLTGYLTGMIPSGVSSSISGGNFIINADSSATGSFAVYLSARDNDNHTVSESFSVTIADPPATPLSPIGGKSFAFGIDEDVEVLASELFSGGMGSVSIVDAYIEDHNLAYVSLLPYCGPTYNRLSIGPVNGGHLGTSTLTVVTKDSAGWARFGSFPVSVAPGVEFNDEGYDESNIFEFDDWEPIVPTIRLSVNEPGTVYLAPSTERILSVGDLEALVTTGKAVKQAVASDQLRDIDIPVNPLPKNKVYSAYLVYGGGSHLVSAPSKARAFISDDPIDFYQQLATAASNDYRIGIDDVITYAKSHQEDVDQRNLKYLLGYIPPFYMPE